MDRIDYASATNLAEQIRGGTLTPAELMERTLERIETVNPDRCTDCGSGVNFGSREWCERNYTEADLWRCRIEWEDLADVVVPYGTDGKARCARLRLLELAERGAR